MSNTRPDIVLIEDNPEDAEVTLRALRKCKVANTVAWLKDGAEAVAFIWGTAEKPVIDVPRVILLDLRLPKVDGTEILARLKADPRRKAIPVCVLTSSTQEQDIKRCYDLGANSYVSKPVHFEEFAHAVAELGMYWLMVNKPPIFG